MAVFVRLVQKNGSPIYVRPEMVKAIYEQKHGSWIGSNVVIDGHDFDVEGSPANVMDAVQHDVHEEP